MQSFDFSIGAGGMSRGFTPRIQNMNPEEMTIVFPTVQEYSFVTEVSAKYILENLRKVRKYAYPFIGITFELPFPLHNAHPYEVIYSDGKKESFEENFDWSGCYLDFGAEIVLREIPHLMVGFSFDFLHPLTDRIGHSIGTDVSIIRRPILFKIKVGILIPHSKG